MKMLEMDYEEEVQNMLHNLKSYELRELEVACQRITEALLNIGVVSEDVLTLTGLIKIAEESITKQEHAEALAAAAAKKVQ